MADLACPWEHMASRAAEPPSWRIARSLVGDGAAGIVVPSFAAGAGPADRNVLFWRWSDAPPHNVRVIDDEARLPRDDRSWEA